jgi:hypothetical protein
LLATHAHLLGVLPQLIRHVDACDDQQTRGDQEQPLAADLSRVTDCLLQRLAAERHQRWRVVPQHDRRDDRDDAELRHGLDQLDQAAHREHALDAFERIEAAELRHHRARSEAPAAERQRRDDRGEGDRTKHRRRQPQAFSRRLAERRQHVACVGCLIAR